MSQQNPIHFDSPRLNLILERDFLEGLETNTNEFSDTIEDPEFSKVSDIAQKSSESPKRENRKAEKESLSLRLYFLMVRTGFVIMIFLALSRVPALWMTMTFNCDRFRSVHGDVECPVNLFMMFNPRYFSISPIPQQGNQELDKRIFLRTMPIRHICLILMAVTSIWGSVYQKILIGKKTKKIKNLSRSIMVCNLRSNTTSEGLMRYLSARGGREEELEVNLILFVNAALGNMNRRRRINHVNEILEKLRLDLQTYENPREEKIIMKLIKGYENWQKIYQGDLNLFEKYSKDTKNKNSGIAFVNFKSEEQAREIIKNSQKATKLASKEIISTWLGCCFSGGRSRPKVLRAEHPQELNWNLIGYSRPLRQRSRRKSCFMICLMMGVTFYVIIVSLAGFQFYLPYKIRDLGLFLTFCRDYVPSIFIVIMSNLGSKVLEKYERNEIHFLKSKYFRVKVWRQVFFQLIIYYLSLVSMAAILAFKAHFITYSYKINFVFYILKFTFVKGFFEPFSTAIDLRYFWWKIKSKRALSSLKKNSKKVENKYRFYPKNVLKRIIDRPELTLDKRYRNFFTILILDTLNSSLNVTPFISISFLILQYIADKLFSTKRYKDPNLEGFLKNKNMIEALQIIPKLSMLNEVFSCLNSGVQIPKNFFWYICLSAIFFSVLMLTPFSSIAEIFYRKIEEKNNKTKGGRKGQKDHQSGKMAQKTVGWGKSAGSNQTALPKSIDLSETSEPFQSIIFTDLLLGNDDS